MGSYYSILSNDADSNGQHHFYFYVSDEQMVNWFRLFHGAVPLNELEMKSTQTETIEITEVEDYPEVVEAKYTQTETLFDQSPQNYEIQQSAENEKKKKKKGFLAFLNSIKKRK